MWSFPVDVDADLMSSTIRGLLMHSDGHKRFSLSKQVNAQKSLANINEKRLYDCDCQEE